MEEQKELTSGGADPLKNVLDTVGLTDENLQKIKELGDSLAGKFEEKIEEGKEKLEDLKKEANKAVSELGELRQAAEDQIAETLKEGKEKFGKFAGEAEDVVSEKVKEETAGIATKLEDAKEKLGEIAKEVNGAVSGKVDEIEDLGTKGGEMITEKLKEGKEKLDEFGKHADEKVSEKTAELGELEKEAAQKIAGLVSEGEEKLGEFKASADEMTVSVGKSVDEGEKGILDYLGTISDSMKGVTNEVSEEIAGKVAESKEYFDKKLEGEHGDETEELVEKSHFGQVEGSVESKEEQIEKSEQRGVEGVDFAAVGGTLKQLADDISGKVSEKFNEGRELLEEKLLEKDGESEKHGDEVEQEGRSDNQGYFGGVDFAAVGGAMKQFADDISGKVSEKVQEGREFLEEALHDEGKDHREHDEGAEKQVQDSYGYLSGVDFSGVGSTLRGVAEGISEKISEGREFLEEKMHEKNEDSEKHDGEIEQAESGNQGHFGSVGEAVKEFSSDISGKILEKVKEGREFLDEHINKPDEEGRVVHEHMGGIYVKGVEEADEGEGSDFDQSSGSLQLGQKTDEVKRIPEEEKQADSGQDFLGEADFGNLQSTMKDVFNKEAQREREDADEVLLETEEHLEEPPVVKKILPAGENVPEQVGTLSETGVYYDDYEPVKQQGGDTSVLEDFMGGKVGEVGNVLEKATDIHKKSDGSPAADDTAPEPAAAADQSDGKKGEEQQKEAQIVEVAGDVEETFAKKREFEYTIGLDDNSMEADDIETQQIEERRHSGNASPTAPPPPPTKQDEHDENKDGWNTDSLHDSEGLTSPLPTRQHAKDPDSLTSAAKHAEEKVHEVTSEPILQDLSQPGPENKELETGNRPDETNGVARASSYHRDERAQSFDVGGSNLMLQESDLLRESCDTAAPLIEFPRGFDAKHRSVSLSSEENLRIQQKFIGPCVPIPVKIEDAPPATGKPEEPVKVPFGVAGPGEILIETVLVSDTHAVPSLYSIPSENEFETDANNSVEPEFPRSGSEASPEPDFVCEPPVTIVEKENEFGSEVVPRVPHEGEVVPNVPHEEEKSKPMVNEGEGIGHEALPSVPAAPISENVPAAIESPALEDAVKFSAAPIVHENAPHHTVQHSEHVEEEMVSKTEIKALEQKSEPKHESAKRIFTTKYESRGGPPDRAPPPIPPPKSTVPLQPPALPPKNVPPPVPPKKKSIEMILAEEAKAMGQHSLRGSEKLIHEAVSPKAQKEETKQGDESAPRDKDAGSSEAQKPVEQVTVKAEEKHELEQKPDTKSHKEETTQSAPAQKPEPEKAETQQTKPEETKPREATDEKGKTDTLKSKGGDSQQQQPARRRCTIL